MEKGFRDDTLKCGWRISAPTRGVCSERSSTTRQLRAPGGEVVAWPSGGHI